MASRDPVTGQFVSTEGVLEAGEQFTVRQAYGVPASDLSGASAFDGGQAGSWEGEVLLDFDSILDRDEVARMVAAYHGIEVYANSTATADGTVRGSLEVSASPARQVAGGLNTLLDNDLGDTSGDVVVEGTDVDQFSSDSLDIIGRPLEAIGHGPITDGTNGVGGGGSAGRDRWEGMPADPVFHPRDELFSNGHLLQWNIADRGIHMDAVFQWVFDIVER